MNVQKTDQIPGDTNTEIPRIIKRGSISVTSVDVSGSFAIGSSSVTLPDILYSNHNIVEVYEASTSGGYANRLNNYQPGSTNAASPYGSWFYLDSTTSGGQTVLRINVTVANTPAATFEFIYVVYSSTYI